MKGCACEGGEEDLSPRKECAQLGIFQFHQGALMCMTEYVILTTVSSGPQ